MRAHRHALTRAAGDVADCAPLPRVLQAPHTARLATPFAVLGIRTVHNRLASMEYLPRGAASLAPTDRVAAKVCRQIERYLEDPEFRFDLEYDYEGTAFQERVWRAIAAIPSGTTRTYSDIARAIGSGPRPVGAACGANRIPLVIPCHRVVAAGGLGGFMNASSGEPLQIKKWLLRHEGA
jgi:methylated-DNA-[protein]-cysteine S-methyltransferase